MKTLTQKRDEVIELPKKIWATTSGTKGVVVKIYVDSVLFGAELVKYTEE